MTAVIASHNGAAYLPETLAALCGQSRVPDQFIAIDAASTDETAALFREHLPSTALFLEAPAGGFGTALTAASEHLPEPEADIQDWLWIHHDDAAPAPDSLAVLLDAVERSPAVVIAGCKQVQAGRERALLDVGLSVTRHAERLTMLELDEQDQGQHDRVSDVFAVNSAGTLVRLDVWRRLQGFDPSLPFVGDDIDLAWRARAAGHRVVVVPQARMIHEPLGVKSRVDRTAQRRASSYLRLKHAPALALPFVALAVIFGGIGRFFSGVFAKDISYGAGQLGASFAPLWHPFKLFKARRLAAKTNSVPRSVVRRAFADPREVAHIRRRNRDLHAARVAAASIPTASQAGGVSHSGGIAGSADLAHATGGHDDFEALEGTAKPSNIPALTALSVLTLVLSLVGFRQLLGAPSLVGGSLVPLSTSLAETWHNATSWWQNTFLGVAGAADPFDALILAANAVSGNHANVVGVTVYLGAMTLAAWSAYWFLRTVTSRIGWRFVGALLWAVHPTLFTALATGRPGAVLAHLVLPVAAGLLLAALGIKGGGPIDSQHGTRVAHRAGLSLALALISVGSPITGVFANLMIFVAAVVAAVVVAFVRSSRRRTGFSRRVRALWWTPLASLVVFAPLLVQTLSRWLSTPAANGGTPEHSVWTQAVRAFLLEPGQPQAYTPAPLWQQLLGFPLEFSTDASVFGLPVLVAVCVVSAPLVLIALIGFLRTGVSGAIARYAGLFGVLALVASGAATLVTVALDRGSVVVPYVGPLVSLFTLAMVTAAISAMRAGVPQAARRTGAAVLTLAVLASSALFIVPRVASTTDADAIGAGQRVNAGRDSVLPATAADRGRGEFEERTLVIETGASDSKSEASPALQARLMNQAGDTLDSVSAVRSVASLGGTLWTPERVDASAADSELRNVVGSIVTGNSTDVRATLAGMGVSFVVIDGIVDPTDPLLSRIRSVPGLAEVGDTSAGWLWRVGPLDGVTEATGQPAASTANVRVLNADGSVAQFVPSNFSKVKNFALPQGDAGRVVVLAQQRDSGWMAHLNGQQLERAINVPGVPAWAQAFQLPETAGTLEIRYESPWRVPVFVGGALILLVILLLAIPLPKRQLARLSEAQRYRKETPVRQTDADEQTATAAEEVSHVESGHREARA
nr:glycosyltransferase [Neomicrococcus lactis]